MSMTTIYRGTFVSVDGIHYQVDIKGTDNGTVADPADIVFAADTPVEIEWSEVNKIDPVQGSALTLTLLSEEDRQYIDLYTIEPGTIRVDVYREGELYWSGMLDPELYEEPYSWKKDYEVQFVFSDFGILDRKKWTMTGLSTMEDILMECIKGTGIVYSDIVKYISTTKYLNGPVIDFSSLYLLNDNFYDEDGEPMTVREVLEAILQPFALRIVQKGGCIYIYDLNAIYKDMDQEEVYWKSDDAVLGADKVYNNVKVTFSPYAESKILDGSIAHDDVKNTVSSALWKMDNNWDDTADGFAMYLSETSVNGLTLLNGAKIFRIDSYYSGSDEAGIAFAYRGSQKWNYDHTFGSFTSINTGLIDVGKHATDPIIQCPSAFLGYISYKKADYLLKIGLSVLFDVRYNPFESASKNNEQGNYDNMTDWCNLGYIPVMLYLKDANGNILYHYENSEVMLSNGYKQTGCQWVEGEGLWGCMYLCYYDRDNRKSASGFGGWANNKQIIGYYSDGLPKKWEAMGDGEFISLPPTCGWLELHIGKGVHQFDYKREVKDIYSKARWLMYKDPTITLVKKNGIEVSQDDIEDTAWVNRNAEEELEIDTMVGTFGSLDKANAAARGVVMDSNYQAITVFVRAGVSDRPAKLLIGTVYSQYASRKMTLSGTVRLLDTMHVLTDESAEGKFVMLSEVQDLMQDTSEVLMSEFVADNYEGIEYE